MKILKSICVFALQILFAFFLAYWAIFVFYTIEKWIHGGTDRVLQWYAHVSTEGTDLIFKPFDMHKFVIAHVVYLAITVASFVGYRRLEAKA